MSAVWYWSRRSMRARWRSHAGVALLLALLGGLDAGLGGRRPPHRLRLPPLPRRGPGHGRPGQRGRLRNREPRGGGPDAWCHRFRDRTSAFLAGALTPEGGPDLSFQGEVAGSVDGLYFSRDRFAVTEGRLPDPSRPDEVAVNERMADIQDVAVRPHVRHRRLRPGPRGSRSTRDTPPPFVDRLEVTVVGIGLFPDEVVQDDTDRIARMLFTPAFTTRNQAWASYRLDGRRGSTVAPPVSTASSRRLPGRAARGVPGQLPGDLAGRSPGRSRRCGPWPSPSAPSRRLAAVATLLLVGQGIVRLLRADRADLSTLRAMGAGPRTGGRRGPPRVGGDHPGRRCRAQWPSPSRFPPRADRAPSPGRGRAGGLLRLGGARPRCRRLRCRPRSHRPRLRRPPGAPPPPGERPRAPAGRPSWVPSRLRACRCRRWPACGWPWRRGRAGRRYRCGPRSAGAVVAVIALVASLVFGTSLRSLVDDPRLYGWDWDAHRSRRGRATATSTWPRPPRCSTTTRRWPPGRVSTSSRSTSTGVTSPLSASRSGPPVGPPILSGRQVEAPGEVVLGSTTLADLGKRIGDTVVLDPGGVGRSRSESSAPPSSRPSGLCSAPTPRSGTGR